MHSNDMPKPTMHPAQRSKIGTGVRASAAAKRGDSTPVKPTPQHFQIKGQ